MLCTVLLPNLIVSCYSNSFHSIHGNVLVYVTVVCGIPWGRVTTVSSWLPGIDPGNIYHDSPTRKSSCLLPLCRLTLPWIHEYLNSYKYSSVSLLVVSSTAIGLHCMTHAVPAVQLWYILCTVTSRVCACLDLKSCNFCLDCPISIILWFSGTLKWALSFGILKRGGEKCKIR